VRFGELIRKLWNRHNFKGQVSPHEFMQASDMLHVTCYMLHVTSPTQQHRKVLPCLSLCSYLCTLCKGVENEPRLTSQYVVTKSSTMIALLARLFEQTTDTA
jgi:hypothetical protein